MMIGVFGQQPFGLGNTDQSIVGTDERQGWECRTDTFLMCQPGSCQLHCIVCSKWMPVRQEARSIDDGRRQIDNVVPMREIIVERR